MPQHWLEFELPPARRSMVVEVLWVHAIFEDKHSSPSIFTWTISMYAHCFSLCNPRPPPLPYWKSIIIGMGMMPLTTFPTYVPSKKIALLAVFWNPLARGFHHISNARIFTIVCFTTSPTSWGGKTLSTNFLRLKTLSRVLFFSQESKHVRF